MKREDGIALTMKNMNDIAQAWKQQAIAAEAKLVTVNAEVERLRAFAEGVAEQDCAYGDGCTEFAQRALHHSQCDSCAARAALADLRPLRGLRLGRKGRRLPDAVGPDFSPPR